MTSKTKNSKTVYSSHAKYGGLGRRGRREALQMPERRVKGALCWGRGG